MLTETENQIVEKGTEYRKYLHDLSMRIHNSENDLIIWASHCFVLFCFVFFHPVFVQHTCILQKAQKT